MSLSDLPPDLESLAAEICNAIPNPKISEGLQRRLLSPFIRTWTFRGAMHRSPLLRVAASVLLLLFASVPVLAVIALNQSRQSVVPILKFEPKPHFLPKIVKEEPPLVGVAPPTPSFQDPLDDAWAAAVSAENQRLKWLQSWAPALRVVAPWTPLPAAVVLVLERSGS